MKNQLMNIRLVKHHTIKKQYENFVFTFENTKNTTIGDFYYPKLKYIVFVPVIKTGSVKNDVR